MCNCFAPPVLKYNARLTRQTWSPSLIPVYCVTESLWLIFLPLYGWCSDCSFERCTMLYAAHILNYRGGVCSDGTLCILPRQQLSASLARLDDQPHLEQSTMECHNVRPSSQKATKALCWSFCGRPDSRNDCETVLLVCVHVFLFFFFLYRSFSPSPFYSLYYTSAGQETWNFSLVNLYGFHSTLISLSIAISAGACRQARAIFNITNHARTLPVSTKFTQRIKYAFVLRDTFLLCSQRHRK